MVRYHATVNHFIRLIDYKRIINIKKDEILDYLDLVKDNDAIVCHIKEFLKFLISNSFINFPLCCVIVTQLLKFCECKDSLNSNYFAF